jgi:hypothetical protein
MSDDPVRDFIRDCEGMSEEEIIAVYHAAYFEKAKPHVRKAFEKMGIAAHEVDDWVYRNIK